MNESEETLAPTFSWKEALDLASHQEGDDEWFSQDGGSFGWKATLVMGKIQRAWRNEFVSKMDTLEVDCSPLVKEKDVTRVPISSCSKCNFIIDVEDFIKAKSAGIIYDGSSLDQLQKKLIKLDTKCPRCQEGVFDSVVLGVEEVMVVLGGTTVSSLARDPNRVEDLETYKAPGAQSKTFDTPALPPSSIQTTEAASSPTTTPTLEVSEKDKEEIETLETETQETETQETETGETETQETEKTQERETPAHSWLCSSWSRKLRSLPLDVNGYTQVGKVYASQIGKLTSPLHFLLRPNIPTEMCTVYNLVEEKKQFSEIQERLQNNRVRFVTEHNQYVGATGSTWSALKSSAHLMGRFPFPTTFISTLLEVENFLSSLLKVAENKKGVMPFVWRQLLTCETLHLITPGALQSNGLCEEGVVAWNLETNPKYIEAGEAISLVQVVGYYPKAVSGAKGGKNASSLVIRAHVETILFVMMMYQSTFLNTF